MRIGQNGGLGPLSVGMDSHPIGAVRITGGAQADIFAYAGRFSERPGIWLLPWVGTTKNGTPVVGPGRYMSLPDLKPPYGPMTLLQGKNKDGVYLLHLDGMARIQCFRLEASAQGFGFAKYSEIKLPDIPRPPVSIAAFFNENGSLEILLTLTDGVRYRPKKPGWRDMNYVPYSGSGRWTGGYPWLSFYAVTAEHGLNSERADNFRRVSSGEHEVLLRGGSLVPLPPEDNGKHDFIAATWFGDFYFYRNTGVSSDLVFSRKQWLRDVDGNVLRHPTCGAVASLYPTKSGQIAGFLAGGQGAIYFYRMAGRGKGSDFIFSRPTPVLQVSADLYGGSLPVPGIVDMDGDGLEDLIVGNSEGRILFFHNQGTEKEASFAAGVPMFAAGEEILVQPGARGSIQGPSEARWGYLSPTPVDWNGDGLPDIVASSARAEHIVWINIGTRTQPMLRAAQTLLCDGLELRGTWRVRPAAAAMGKRMAYITLDDDDELHLYWRLDNRNLQDAGKLRLPDGSSISANIHHAGGTGRLKLLLHDWDEDGIVDLLLGTSANSSVPDKSRGMPVHYDGKTGASVLFMKNIGSNELPILDFPKFISYQGEPLFFGSHECAPAVGSISGEPCLIVGKESGRLVYFRKAELGLSEAKVKK